MARRPVLSSCGCTLTWETLLIASVSRTDMRMFRFGVIVAILASVYGAFLAIRLLQPLQLPAKPPNRPVADVSTVKSDLCRLASAERAYFKLTGAYATETELRSSGELSLPPGSRWPYQYLIKIPAPDTFTIVAARYGPSNDRPTAVVTDARGQVCTFTWHRPENTHQLDNPPQDWRGAPPKYDCEACPAGW